MKKMTLKKQFETKMSNFDGNKNSTLTQQTSKNQILGLIGFIVYAYLLYIYTIVFVSVYKCLLKTVHWLWLSPNNHIV